VRCTPPRDEVRVTLWVNDRLAGHLTCGEGVGFTSVPADKTVPGSTVQFAFGMSVGVPSPPTSPTAVPPGRFVGTFAVAVMRKIPLTEYSFPARPASLPPISEIWLAPEPGATFLSGGADPNAPQSVVWPVSPRTSITVVAQTPGTMTIEVPGSVSSETASLPSTPSVDNSTHLNSRTASRRCRSRAG
jgi:hypothetical protein